MMMGAGGVFAVLLLIVLLAVTSGGGGGGGGDLPSDAPPPNGPIRHEIPGVNDRLTGTPFFAADSEKHASSQCAAMVKNTLNAHLDELAAHPGARIGQILGAQFNADWPESKNFETDCCQKGTDYDHFMVDNVMEFPYEEFLGEVNSRTALIIVDMQNDFTRGSFGQACWGQRGPHFLKRMRKLAEAMHDKGATIIASIDLHPNDHCSFNGTCKNTKDAAEPHTTSPRYTNFFPSHCTYVTEGDTVRLQKGAETPFCQSLGDAASNMPFCADAEFTGAALEDDIFELLKERERRRPESTYVMFKGFDKDYDSFSVIPHVVSCDKSGCTKVSDDEKRLTGGYTLFTHKWKNECVQHASSTADPRCMPTAQHLKDAGKGGGGTGMLEFLRSKNINQVVSVGLVYDYCVKETGIFAKELARDPGNSLSYLPDAEKSLDSIVLADFTRPSFDGKPGSPFNSGMCEVGLIDGEYCVKGGGTPRAHLNVLADYDENDVKVMTLPGFKIKEQFEDDKKYWGLANAYEHSSKCTAIVKTMLADHKDELHPINWEQSAATDIGARIGQVLLQGIPPGSWAHQSLDFMKDCCGGGTEFDHMVLDQVGTQTADKFLEEVDAQTMLIIVDMQKDFTVGSFGQACWEHGGKHLSERIAKLARKMAARGATIVASKDLHPHDHCSFGGSCKNTKVSELEFTEVLAEGSTSPRYVNFFPSHCTYTVENNIVTPQKGGETPFCKALGGTPPYCSQDDFSGAAFDDDIAKALRDIAGVTEGSVEVVFKGFDKDYDSFSAMPHLWTSGDATLQQDEKDKTGGYALNAERKKACFETLSNGGFEDPLCYPTQEEVQQPPGKMRSMLDIMKDKDINKVVSVGLVYDFCVKETAIFTKEWAQSEAKATKVDSIVLADYSRPSFDGKPGAPFVAAACGGKPDAKSWVAEGEFCLGGGGTMKLHEMVTAEFVNTGVDVRRLTGDFKDSQPSEVVQV
jgi:nicotinamidase-related amidase